MPDRAEVESARAPKARAPEVAAYFTASKTEAAKPLSAEEKAARIESLKARLPGYEKQFVVEGKRLSQAESAKDDILAEQIRDLLEQNFNERKAIVAELRSLGETVTDRTDG